jgi:transcriptional regulator with XRE-family HTH domain
MKDQRTQELARTIGKQIAKARRALGITQEEAAERIGITVEYYARLERGQSLPSLLTFAQMSVALEVSAESLMSLGDVTARPIAAPPPWYLAPQTDESKQLSRLFRRLRGLPPELVAAAESVVKQLERFLDKQRKKGSRETH